MTQNEIQQNTDQKSHFRLIIKAVRGKRHPWPLKRLESFKQN